MSGSAPAKGNAPLRIVLTEPAAAKGRPQLLLLAQLLRRAVRPSKDALEISPDFDWDVFVQIAQENRLLLMAARGLQESGQIVPEGVLKTIARYRALTLSLNGANLVTLRGVIAALDLARIEVIGLKGPVALSALHGDAFIRPSTDIDLLVFRKDFRRAGEVITASGFMAPRGADTIWWRTFLGEQHYYGEGKAPIDLHHRIQQPECPAPRSLEAFWRDRTYASVGKAQVPVLSPTHAALLSCMSLAKAIAQREAAGAYVWDIAVYLASSTPPRLLELSEAARNLGLLNTLRLGVRTARVVTGIAVEGMSSGNAMAFVPDADLAAIILAPEKASAVSSYRTRLLSSLSDNAVDLVKNMTWAMAARTARLSTPRRKVVQREWEQQLAARR